MDVDPEEQTEVIRVPKHNDVDASDVLNDFANVRIFFLIESAFTQVAFIPVRLIASTDSYFFSGFISSPGSINYGLLRI